MSKIFFLGLFLSNFVLAAEIEKQVLKLGAGDAANSGDKVRITYKLWVKEKLIEKQNELNVILDEKKLVPGLYKGILGATKGTQFVMAVPPELGYGARQEGEIPPDSTLKYEIEILEVFKK